MTDQELIAQLHDLEDADTRSHALALMAEVRA